MCIAIVTTAHPKYPLILLSNRDEFIRRPTDPARWWPHPDSNILGGRDLYRPEHGTWLGVTRDGRLAVLTNFREEGAVIEGRRSRGAIVNAYLRSTDGGGTSRETAHRLIEDGLSGVGGFSLMFGQLRRPSWQHGDDRAWEGLAIVSNRSEHVDDVRWICSQPGETHALSNSHYGDTSWPKVVSAEKLVQAAVKASSEADETQEQLISRLLDILSLDTMPRREEGEEWEAYLGKLRRSIFVPALGKEHDRSIAVAVAGDGRVSTPNGLVAQGLASTAGETLANSGVYGTQKQSVIMVDWQGDLLFLERSLFDQDGSPVEAGKGDSRFQYHIQGWDGIGELPIE